MAEITPANITNIGIDLDLQCRDDINNNFKNLQQKDIEVINRVNNIIAAGGESNVEIVDARHSNIKDKTYNVLTDRLNAIEEDKQNIMNVDIEVADQTELFALTTADVDFHSIVKQLDTNITYIVTDTTNLSNINGYTTIQDYLKGTKFDADTVDGIQGADLVKKDGSIAMDNLTIGTRKSGSTVGTNSFVQGKYCEASGVYSHAEGDSTTASGSRSHAEGCATTASGNYSHAQNRYTIAQGYSQTAIGRYNIAQGTGTGMSATDDAFIIGNGTSTSLRSNAFKVSFDGKAWAQEGYYVGASNNEVLHEGNISSSALNFANTSGIKGTGSGPTNLSYFQFFENDGTTRQGYIGYGDTAGTLYIWNELNTDVYIKTNGTGKAKVNGKEIYHAGNISSSALNLANASGVKGTGTGTSNLSYLNFYESDGTTIQGSIGKRNNALNTIYFSNEITNGNIVLLTNGTGKAYVNGNEIYHAGNISSSALNLANASGIKGTGTGTSNLSYLNFYESDGTTLDAFIGIDSSSNNTFTIGNLNTNANINISPSPGGKATVNDDTIVTSKSTVPPVPNSTGKVGQVAGDANYFYYCYASNTWARYAKSTW